MVRRARGTCATAIAAILASLGCCNCFIGMETKGSKGTVKADRAPIQIIKSIQELCVEKRV